MALSLGIKLVILLPTFLFFVGFSFKSFVDKKGMKELEKLIHSTGNISLVDFLCDYLDDFYILLAIDSIFILIANGLIIIFELEQSELGILTIIFGVIFSVYLMISIYTKNTKTAHGIIGIFFILGAEFFYFLFHGINILPNNYGYMYENILKVGIGGGLGSIIGTTVIINTLKDSVESMSSYMKERCKRCEDSEKCKVKLEDKQ